MSPLIPPPLTGLIACVWATERSSPPTGCEEWSIPTGAIHIAVRSGGPPVSVNGERVARAVVGGPRGGAYRRDTPGGARSLGVVLAPGASPALFGRPATELRDRHVALAELLGPASAAVEEAFDARGADAGVAALLGALAERVDARRLPDRPLTHAIRVLRAGVSGVADVAAQVGWSERHLRERVVAATGLGPREIQRLARLQRLLARVAVDGGASWTERAMRLGYADAAHLSREFRALTGLTPTAYRSTPGAPNHVPIAPSETSKPRLERRVILA